jgi:hypothetical protein
MSPDRLRITTEAAEITGKNDLWLGALGVLGG